MGFAWQYEFWPTVAAFEAHLAQHDPRICAWVEGIVYHHTAIPTLAQWRGRASMDGLARYYRDEAPWTDAQGRQRKGWSAAPHLFVAPEGIYQGTPLDVPGIHALGANANRWGLEVVGDYTRVRWADTLAELALGAGAALLRWRGIAPSRQTVQGHSDYNKPTCPGKAIDLAWVAAEVARRAGTVPSEVLTLAPAPAQQPITQDSLIVHAPRAAAGNLLRTILRRPTGHYTPEDVSYIVRRYETVCLAADVDPLIAVAQMVHETGNLTSAWSQRPHRNPAGLGVTGAPGKGLSFARWDDAIDAHVGRLLAYAVVPSQATPAQQRLVERALSYRSLPAPFLGSAPSLRGLTSRWATDAVEPHDPLTYAEKLARTANALREAA
jgi:hypothetical protein